MKIFFSVGEPSGDQHAAHLVAELQSARRDIECIGFGGPSMRDAGCRIDFELTELAVMGVLKVLPLIQKFRGLLRQATELFERERPDAVILVDFPGFNWWIARAAKRAGIPVFYYCPPQLWAWAAWRIRKVKRFVDHVLACLPFEAEWYQKRGVAAKYVGHPFFDEIADKPLDASFLRMQRAAEGRRIAILPGSRTHEVHANFPIQIEVMRKLAREFPDIRFLVANYKESQRQYCEQLIQKSAADLPIELHVGKTSEILELAECCLMVSGSVSLEVLARGIPAVVQYRGDWIFALIASLLVRCRFMTLPNLVVDREIMPEYWIIGSFYLRRTTEKITNHFRNWLSSPMELARAALPLLELRDTLAKTGATKNAARFVLEKLEISEQRVRAA
ncbi:MAG: lipid-A-disaccharide synthase [Planctomycetaceae bacterium]|nr:lipid-A-disaccharide synthase [Planctomycetaceae bacterium]